MTHELPVIESEIAPSELVAPPAVATKVKPPKVGASEHKGDEGNPLFVYAGEKYLEFQPMTGGII